MGQFHGAEIVGGGAANRKVPGTTGISFIARYTKYPLHSAPIPYTLNTPRDNGFHLNDSKNTKGIIVERRECPTRRHKWRRSS